VLLWLGPSRIHPDLPRLHLSWPTLLSTSTLSLSLSHPLLFLLPSAKRNTSNEARNTINEPRNKRTNIGPSTTLPVETSEHYAAQRPILGASSVDTMSLVQPGEGGQFPSQFLERVSHRIPLSPQLISGERISLASARFTVSECST